MSIPDSQLDAAHTATDSLPNCLIPLLHFFLFRFSLPILLVLLNQFREIRSLFGRAYEFMFQKLFRRRTLEVSLNTKNGTIVAYSSRITLTALADEILEWAREFGIVKLRRWVLGNDKQNLGISSARDESFHQA
jgi:hypothetical protein